MKNKTFDFTITRQDYLNSSKLFETPSKCPMAVAFNRLFPAHKEVEVFMDEILSKNLKIAILGQEFGRLEFEQLRKYGKNFKTTITFD